MLPGMGRTSVGGTRNERLKEAERSVKWMYQHGMGPVIPGSGISEESRILLHTRMPSKLSTVSIENDFVLARMGHAHTEVRIRLVCMEIEHPVECTTLKDHHLFFIVLHDGVLPWCFGEY